MKFEYSKAEIEKVAREQNYTANNIEKVLRLSLILNDLNIMPEFKGKLLLKGGTAINLIAFDKLPRLSVDLDLDFAENISKDKMLEEREKISQALDEYCRETGYLKVGRCSFSLDSFSLFYTTVTGSRDKIKLDINYHNRCHVFDGVNTGRLFPFSTGEELLSVFHVSIIELFAGKIKAFYERCKPRDIYDIYSLATSGILSSEEERNLLRKCIVFYGTLGNTERPELFKQDISHILDMPFRDIKTQLLPMLHTNSGKYPKDEINHTVIDYLSSLVTLTESEQQYMNEFYKGNYQPSLMFDDVITTRLLDHPVARRTQQQLKEKTNNN